MFMMCILWFNHKHQNGLNDSSHFNKEETLQMQFVDFIYTRIIELDINVF